MTRVFRLWQREGLKVRVMSRKRGRSEGSAHGCRQRRGEAVNGMWCLDIVEERTECGNQLKCWSVADKYIGELFVLKMGRGITNEYMGHTLREWSQSVVCPGAFAATMGRSSPLRLYGTGLGRWLLARPPSCLEASGRTATPNSSTGDSATGFWRLRSPGASSPSGRLRALAACGNSLPPRVRHPLGQGLASSRICDFGWSTSP